MSDKSRWREDETIKKAISILEGRKDDLAKRLAVELGETPLDLQRLHWYSAYIQGARKAYDMAWEEFGEPSRDKDSQTYRRAAHRLISSSFRSMELFLQGTPIAFRNWVEDKKGHVTDCEAYFYRNATIMQEVK